MWPTATRCVHFDLDVDRRFEATVNGTGYDVSVRVPLRDGDELLQRLICHAFVSFMPPEGLEESLSALADYFEYHRPSERGLPAPARTIVAHGHLVEN